MLAYIKELTQMTSPYITEPEPRRPLRTCLPTNDDRRALTPFLRTQHHRRGAFLFHAGEGADQLFWVCHGIVKVSAPTLEGCERLLQIFGPGDIFGMSWLNPAQRRVSMAQALSPVDLQTTTDAELTQLLRLRPDLSSDLLRSLFDQQGRVTLRLEALLNAHVGERLLAILLDLGVPYGQRIVDGYLLCHAEDIKPWHLPSTLPHRRRTQRNSPCCASRCAAPSPRGLSSPSLNGTGLLACSTCVGSKEATIFCSP